ncbi:glycosyltransferase family 2 protein [Facklamia sp. 7083-14-GEN3]|uniref:glycosyltransferase family 2 protein n=1 Tax=Facklamia sp. 7083-14-GEN3 TaxID=2973478 RepID=UPI00215BC77C|nr:glycosyltransferase family 2 protein [Facklamia sp. 7083-14-GEN3]MCR8968935.1 glycosyltransferase [Facklamia sp. 7083-14-GEN3]
MNIFFSIIIPLFNSEKYIKETLESIINQKFQNFEIIVVDDGSTDSSAKIIKEFYGDNNKIKYHYKINEGASIARNFGLEKALGKYVIFFDSDDILNPNSLSVIYKFIKSQNNNVDLIVGDYEYNNLLGQRTIKQTKSMLSAKKILTLKESNDPLIFIFLDPAPNFKIIKKEFLSLHNLYFQDLRLGQDLNFYIRMLSYKPKVYFLNHIINTYNLRPGSISTTYNSSLKDIILSLELIKKENNNYFSKPDSKFNTFEFNHVSNKLLKSLKIDNSKLRFEVYSELANYLLNIPTNFDDRFLNTNTYLIRLMSNFPRFFTSQLFFKMRILLVKIRSFIKI